MAKDANAAKPTAPDANSAKRTVPGANSAKPIKTAQDANSAKPTAKSLVKPMGYVADPNVPELLPIQEEENNRFVIQLYDGDCELLYELGDQTITFLDTRIPETARGQGIGKKLAKSAFNYAAENKLDVVIKSCFLAEYYKKFRNKYPKLRITGRFHQEEIDMNF